MIPSEISCSLGGFGVALLIVLIYYRVYLRTKKKEGKTEKAEEGNSPMAHQPNVSERRNRIHTGDSMTFDREVVTLDPWTCDPLHQLSSRTDKNDDPFWFSNFSAEDQRGIRQNPTRWNDRTKARLGTDEEIERRRVRMMITEQDLRRFAAQRGILELTNKLSRSRTSSHPGGEAFVRRVEAVINNGEEEYGQRAQGGGCSQRNEAFYCNSCHRTYTPSEPNSRKGGVGTQIKDHGDFPSQHREFDRDLKAGTRKDKRIRRKSGNVTFDLECLRHSGQRNSQSEEEKTSRDEGRAGKHTSNVQLRRLKVKFNLNPRGRSKVHPRRRTERGHSGRSRSKTSKGNRTGTDTEKKGGTKERHQKRKTSAKRRRLGEEEDGEERTEGNSRQKSTKTPAGEPESTAADQSDHPETTPSVDDGGAVDQSPSDPQHPQDGCFRHPAAPPSLPTAVDTSASLQGGSSLAGASSVFAGWNTHSVSLSAAFSSSIAAPQGAPGTFTGQERLLLASVLPANVLQSPSVYTPPQSLPPPSGNSPFVEEPESGPAGPQPGMEQPPSEVPQNRENMLLKQEPCRAPAVRQSVETENGDGPEPAEVLPLRRDSTQTGEGRALSDQSNATSMPSVASADSEGKAAKVLQQQEFLSEEGGSRRKLRLVLPEKTSSRPLTALERKIR